MVENTDPHSYHVAVTTMTRKMLEEFAIRAAEAMESLEQENAALRSDLDDAMKVDPEVIAGWRRWSQIVDEEREKWADTATRLTEEKLDLKAKLTNALEDSTNLAENIKVIIDRANEDSEEGTNSKAMRKGLVAIAKQGETALSSYNNSITSPEPLPEPEQDTATNDQS